MSPQPPVADQRPVERALWGAAVVDEYQWLRDREDPEVVALLEAENAHTEAILQPTKVLQQQLFDEIRSRVKETDLSVPVVKDGWSYYSRTVEGSPYGIHCRRFVGLDADPVAVALLANDSQTSGAEVDTEVQNQRWGPEQVLLDENVEAGPTSEDDEGYFEIGVFEVTPDHRILAWADDRTGDERFALRFRDLDTGLDRDVRIDGVSYGSAWATDNETLLYVRPDDANRPYQVWRHRLGTDPTCDVLVFQEDDERFFVGIGRDRDDSYLYLGCSSSITDEVWLLPADQPDAEPVCVEPRQDGIEYAVAHHRGTFLVLTNADAENFRIMTTTPEALGRPHWVELVAHRPDVMLTGFDVLDSHLILFERTDGVTRMSSRRWSDGHYQTLAQPEDVYTVWPGANPESSATVYRYGYSSMVTPPAVFIVDVDTGDRRLLRQTEVLGGFDPDHYRTERTWATADDGTQIPMSLVWRADRPEGPGPCLLYGYGAYESSVDPTFSSARLSLLDRGFVFAIAHVRGGGEMGRQWYLNGKLANKANTFTDTVACARHLIEAGWTEPSGLALRGGSAGGLLVGAVLNQAPELFGAAVAQVPFVDVVNTMLDPSLPLTVTEWEEWGNPAASADVYETMTGYAPYENIDRRPYPAILATGGLTDPRVGFWEPTKWVQRLRRHTSTDRPILLWTDMDAGHGGPTGRYAGWRDEARVLAFIVWALERETSS